MMPSSDRYWDSIWSRGPIRKALLISIAVHVGVALAFALKPPSKPPEMMTISYDVDLVTEPDDVSQQPPEAAQPPEPETKPEPEPEPPPPEPEPEPEITPAPPEPEPEPVPVEEPPKPVVKEEPPPEPKPEPEEEKKPEPPKPDPPKPDPPKPELKKPEPKKPEPKKPAEPKPELEQMAKQTPVNVGPQLKQSLPSELSGWARLVQRKVDKTWIAPGGVRVTGDGSEAVISFWVSRDGKLIGRPEIVQHGSDPRLAESGVAALIAANPLPPLPGDYKAQEQQVIYAFRVTP